MEKGKKEKLVQIAQIGTVVVYVFHSALNGR